MHSATAQTAVFLHRTIDSAHNSISRFVPQRIGRIQYRIEVFRMKNNQVLKLKEHQEAMK